MLQVMRESAANPGRSGHRLALAAAEQVYAARKQAAAFFGAESPDQVVFTLNCTHAINFVLKGLLSGGGHVIVSSLEHNAVTRPLTALQSRGVRFSAFTADLFDPEHCVSGIEKLIRPDTKLIFCTHASNVFGAVLPIQKIGALAQKHGLLFGVDAAQTAGILPIDMKTQHIDFCCAPGHKGLYGPMGTGLLLARKPLAQTVIEGGTGTLSASLQQPLPLPERLESGTLNLPGIAGLRAGMAFVAERGLSKLYAHELSLIRRLLRQLSQMPGIQLYTPIPKSGEYVPVLSFNLAGQDSEEVARQLDQHGFAVRSGLQCAALAHRQAGTDKTGTVRVCTGAFNTKAEIDLLAQCLKELQTGKE